MDTTTRLGLPYLLPNQAQKHVTVNESLGRLDTLVHLSVRAADIAEQPAGAADGDRYILPPGAVGPAWSQFPALSVVSFQEGGWNHFMPKTGWCSFVEAAGAFLVFDGEGWVSPDLGSGASAFGINAEPDATNRLSVASPASLFSHEGADHRLKVNKAQAANTASVVFQTGFAGKAEIGLAGDDNWHLKVSPDGQTWRSALVADAATGEVLAANGLAIAAGKRISSPRTPIGSSAAAALELEGGGELGRVALVLKSVGGLTGALFEQRSQHPANIDLVDFGLKSLTHQINLRVEGRTPFTYTGAPEFQIGDSGDGTQPIQPLMSISVRRAAMAVPLQLPAMTVQQLPAGSEAAPGSLVFVTNDAGGPVVAFHDGSAWRRVTDRAVVQS